MQLKILGCGPILQVNPVQNCSGYLVDNQLLFDIGPGVWRALNESGINAAALHQIILSHFHVDHVADIAPFLMARYLMLTNVDRPLSLIGPAGIKAWYAGVEAFCGAWAAQIPVNLIECGTETEMGAYRLRSGLTGHTENSLCYRLEDGAQNTFFYSGDTDEAHIIAELAAGCDLALIEASNREESKVAGHLTPRRAAKLARQAGVNTLVLTHMYPEVDSTGALSEAQNYFSGRTIIAHDGLTIDIDDR